HRHPRPARRFRRVVPDHAARGRVLRAAVRIRAARRGGAGGAAARAGIEVQRMVLTSDETNATWWEEVAAYGWHRVDQSTTMETHSRWHPVLIDAAIQSGEASRGEPNRVLGTV
ncbi:hypothetical protein B0H14DRAFT_2765904, partial [Mycena olivaceomarginata]